MKNNRDDIREKILNQSSYWVEGINSFLYTAIIEYMETNDMNRTKLADYLGISKGRVSQILNDGEINFRIEKVIQIALKVNKFPVFAFQDKDEYLEDLKSKERVEKNIANYKYDSFFEVSSRDANECKVISLLKRNEFNKQLAL